MFGSSGIRGRVGEEVTARLGVDLGSALAAWGAERVVIGRDPRPSGIYLTEAVQSGLRQRGVDVIDVGVAATPTIARAVGWRNASAGVAVTASHNPPTDNGFKLWLPTGQAFRPAEQTAIESRIRDDATPDSIDWQTVGTVSHWNESMERHVTTLTDDRSLPRPLHVILDIGNGAGQVTARALANLGCQVQTINGQPDGRFPGRPSEPTRANCQELREIVPAVGADIGIAHDGDADRMRAVDETGRFLSGDELLAIFALNEADSGDHIVAPINTSLAVEDALATRDIEMIRTRVGDVYIAEAICEHGAVFGGEPSGAWIWPEETLCPDGPLAACVLAEHVAEGPSLATQAEHIETYPLRRDAIHVEDKPGVMQSITETVRDTFAEVETIDGVRVPFKEGWMLIRPSGTEPVIRLTAEARDPTRAEEFLERASELVHAARDTN